MNGLALFSGGVNGPVIIPPCKPLSSFVYRCGSEFYLAPLEAMLHDDEKLGVVVIDMREATIASVDGCLIHIHDTMHSGVGGKHNKGGQSQARFQRLHDEGVKRFQGRVASRMNEIFLDESVGVNKIILAGSFCKSELVDDKHLDYRVRKMVIGLVDAGYDGEAGVREALQRSEGLLSSIEYTRQGRLVQQFMEGLARDNGKSIYGRDEIRTDLLNGHVETLLIGEKYVRENKDLEEIACSMNTRVEYISSSTSDGAMLQGFGGIVAVRRF